MGSRLIILLSCFVADNFLRCIILLFQLIVGFALPLLTAFYNALYLAVRLTPTQNYSLIKNDSTEKLGALILAQ